ncbi:DctP family TRAP transporter solute-binding subunit [Phaeobacter gallaeciensis]|jgi:tripartite ATP-independent transporter DctP family solute receptor|uniref:DctP family TRAP transporter solute-binding subunit n=2 Tax=Phaeobacter gallaeciensis TaxID=60890 RepID=UPI00237FD1EC|nr:DctP family TRAP transporter solute-binding subunit [Phaeobacter gallaeciensis]MDE4306177.1 DctP family TRAP transporter solute-binding subunit [Phaeobacter gallaeciensis]MDE4310643.1 DctP family TRAP transporter solute-binding subunit [Phaeobacter gallaeciensis]MDE4314633.1 DctP family TRAP transporter solute-binding subunit [Phaeobacter gallaeciensis]MDE4319571.1 DctP family TRAP transporter solute-binding subunit [Phaeobacter gallaeciensis]MDE4323999.1 DctP family TRAP transporter solute
MKSMSKLMAASAVIALTAAGPVSAKELKYAHFQAADLSSPKHAAALAFEACVEGKTSGSIDVQIFPASQLGGGSEIMEGLQLGTVQMAAIHDGPISAVYKPFSVLAMPYLFDDQAMAWSVMDGEFGDALAEDMLAKTGIRSFGVADNGVRNFTNNVKPVAEPADMDGLKMRVMTAPVWVTLVESLGASATPVPWPELPGALQQGVVDGQENGVTNIVNASLYQHQKYVSLDGHVFSWHAYLMSDMFYQSLTPSEQTAVSQCVEISKTIHRGMTAAQDANATAILSEKGMEVVPVSPEQKAMFRAAAQPAVREYIVGEIGAEWPDRLDAAVAAYKAQ